MMRAEDPTGAVRLLNAVVKTDSTIFEAHRDLYLYAMFSSDSAKATIHERWLTKLVPWYVGRIKATAADLLQRGQ